MKTLERLSELFGKYMALIVLAVAALSLFLPSSTLWIQMSWINSLLMVVMFGMGLATSLAGTAFPDLAMATVPGAIFSVWHNISGAILAGIYRRI